MCAILRCGSKKTRRRAGIFAGEPAARTASPRMKQTDMRGLRIEMIRWFIEKLRSRSQRKPRDIRLEAR
jgi:hypothetical protein